MYNVHVDGLVREVTVRRTYTHIFTRNPSAHNFKITRKNLLISDDFSTAGNAAQLITFRAPASYDTNLRMHSFVVGSTKAELSIPPGDTGRVYLQYIISICLTVLGLLYYH